MQTEETTLPQPGQIVRVRQRLYLVEDVESQGHGDDCALVRLSCVHDDAQGQALEVFWEHELDAKVLTAENWNALATRDFDPIEIDLLRFYQSGGIGEPPGSALVFG